MFTRRVRSGRTPLLMTAALALVLLAGCADKAPSSSRGSGTGSAGSSSTFGGDDAAPDPGFGIARIGDCTRMTAAQSQASVPPAATVGCGRQHTSVVVYVGYVRTPITPATPLQTRRTLAARLCAPAYRAWTGGTELDRAGSLLTWTFFTPGQQQLERGARWVRCDVVARSGTALVPLPDRRPLLAKGIPTALRTCQTSTGADVSCAGPHAYEVGGIFRATGRTYPGVSSVVARNRCRVLLGGYGGFVQYPGRPGFLAGDRFVRCLTPPGGLPTPSPAPTP